MGADRPRPLRPRAHRAALALDLPRLRRAARPARRSCSPARCRAAPCCAASASRCTRPSTASTPSAGRSSATSRSPLRATRPSGSSAADRRLLEEPRMEAHGVPRVPARLGARALRAARAAGRGRRRDPAALRRRARSRRRWPGGRVTRDLAGRAAVYLRARTHYGVADPAALDRARADLASGARRRRTCAALDALFARLIWIADGDLDALDAPRASTARSSARPTPTPTAEATAATARRRTPGTGATARRRHSAGERRTRLGARHAGRGARAGDRPVPAATSSSSSSTRSKQYVAEVFCVSLAQRRVSNLTLRTSHE